MTTKIHRQAAFSLIELMVVVAIVGILAAVAYPNYQNYILRGRRAAAQAFLLQTAQRQQQYFLDNRSYAPDLTTLGLTLPTDVSPYYEIASLTTTSAPPTFIVSVRPIGTQTSNNEPNLSLDSSGAKTPTGSAYGAW